MKILTILYCVVFGITSALILFIDDKTAVFIPIIWMMYGFVFHFVFSMILYSKLSSDLMDDKKLMEKLKLEIHYNGRQIFMSSLFANFKEIKIEKPELTNSINLYKRTLTLGVLGFFLGIAQVFLRFIN